MERRTVDIIAELREVAEGWHASRTTTRHLLVEAADRLEHFAWDGQPPRTPHQAADSSPNAGDVDAGASSTPSRRVDLGGGEVRLRTARMPLTAAEFSEPDQCDPHGVVRPVLHRGLYVVIP